MKEIILVCYVLCIVFLGSSLTCNVLAGINKKSNRNRSTLFFILGLIMICCYDMGIYYWNYVIGNFSNMEVMRFGNCLIAITMFLWLREQEQIMARTVSKRIDNFTGKYLLFYAGLWLILTTFLDVSVFYTIKWLLLATDIALILCFATSTTVHIIFAAVAEERKKLIFMLTVSALLLWNYIAYFWGETSVYWGNSAFIRAPLDLTVIFWMIISGMTLFYVIQTDVRDLFNRSAPGISDPEAAVPSTASGMSLQERIDKICEQYKLTPREREFVELIYKGKSNREIAEMLFVSESTVKTHIYNIFRKMDVKSRVEVICIVNGEQ